MESQNNSDKKRPQLHVFLEPFKKKCLTETKISVQVIKFHHITKVSENGNGHFCHFSFISTFFAFLKIHKTTYGMNLTLH